MLELADKTIDLNMSTDTTLRGDGVIEYADLTLLYMAVGVLSIIFLLLLAFSFHRLWELHHSVLKSTVRMSRSETKKAVGAEAYRLAQRAKELNKETSHHEVRQAANDLYLFLNRFGLRRVVQSIEVPWLIRHLKQMIHALADVDSVQQVADMRIKALRVRELYRLVETMYGLVQGTHLKHEVTNLLVIAKIMTEPPAVSDGAIVRAEQKVRTRIQKYEHLSEGLAFVTRPQDRVSELSALISDVRILLLGLPAPDTTKEYVRVRLFAQDLREWAELTNHLAYAEWWNLDAQAWFLLVYLGRSLGSVARALFGGN